MNPIYAELQGAIGIKAGLGRDSIALNLSEIVPEGAATVALKGDNGSGKSTLLNLGLVPWREPPSLSGDLYSQFGPKGARILTWEHGNKRYRSEIQISQTAKTKTQKAFLYVEDRAVAWQPVSFPDGLVSDGKVRTYDACLERILGPMSLYYLSAFRAQGADKLSQYSDPKGLMRDLLGLDAIEGKIGRVKLVVREIKRELATWQDKASSARAARDDVAALENRIEQEQRYLNIASAAVDMASSSVTAAEHDLKQAEAGAADVVRAKRAWDEAASALAGCKQRYSDRRAEKNQAIARAKRAAEQTGASYQANLRQAQEQARSLEARIANARNMLAIADQVAESKEALARLQADIEAVQEERDALMERHRVLDGIRAEIAEKQGVLDRVIQEGKTLSERIEDLRRRAGFVAQVPCRGQGEYASCPALREAQEAAAKIPPLEAEKREKVKEWGALSDQMKAIKEREVQAGPRDKIGIQSADQRLETMRKETVEHGRMAARETEVASASAVIEQASADLKESMARASELEETIKHHAEHMECEIGGISAEFDTQIAALLAEFEAAQVTLEETPKPDDTDQTAAARAALQRARARLEQDRQVVDEITGALSTLRSELAAKKLVVERSAAVEKYAAHVADELALYTLLASALRGVIDLTIEDAGPAIAATANALLEASYGARFNVSITTQRTNSQGDLVETFDIEVYDADSGTRSSIVHKSGGESVWLDKALTDAVGLYHQDVSGHSYETLFGDEVEDGLTAERKTQYYRMQRATMERGGYRRMYFVSHNPEAWAVADAVIEMESLK